MATPSGIVSSGATKMVIDKPVWSEEERGERREMGRLREGRGVRLLSMLMGVVMGVVLTLAILGVVFWVNAAEERGDIGDFSHNHKREEFRGYDNLPGVFGDDEIEVVARAGGEAFTIVDIVNDLSRSDMDLIALFFLILVVVDLLWELMTEIFHHNLHKNHPHILAIIERMYLELAVVGLVSMALFFLITSGVFSDHVIHVFEFCHLSLFGVTALFILSMIFVSILSITIFKKWERLELISVDSFEVKKILADIKGVPFYDLVHHYKRGKAKQVLHYWSLRRFFVERLELDPRFPFDRYLKTCTKHLFTELAQVHWSTLALTVFSVLGLYYAFSDPSIDDYGPPLIIFSSIVFFLGGLLHWKTQRIYLNMVAQRERVLVFSKILDDRAEREKNAEQRGENAMEEMIRRSIEIERRMAAGESISDDEKSTSTSSKDGDDPLIGGDEIIEPKKKGFKRTVTILSSPSRHGTPGTPGTGRRGGRSVRRRKRIIDEEDASYVSYSETGSSTSGESYVSSSSSCYSDFEGTPQSKRRLEGADDEQDVDDEETPHHLRHVHHHHHHHHHVDLDEETKLAQSDLYFIIHCCIPCFTCRMNPFKELSSWQRSVRKGHGHESLFWLRSPGLLLYLIQVLLFSQASQIFLAIVSCAQLFPDIHPAYLPFAMLMGLINIFRFIPSIIYHFSMVVNVGVYTKKAVVRKVGKKSRHHRQLEEENEEYVYEEYAEEDELAEVQPRIEREGSSPSHEGVEIEMDVIPREKALEEEEMLVETPGRKKYHHIRRKKEKSKKETHGMVFKAREHNDIDAFLEDHGLTPNAMDNELEELLEHPEDEDEKFSRYLQSSAALNPNSSRRKIRRPQLRKRKKNVKPPQLRMVDQEARASGKQLGPPMERLRTSLDRPRNSLERPRNSIDKNSRSSLDMPSRGSMDGKRRGSMEGRNSLDKGESIHFHHHGV